MDQEHTSPRENKSKKGLIIAVIVVVLLGWYFYANRPAQDEQTDTNGTETGALGVVEKKDVLTTIDTSLSELGFDFDSLLHDGSGRFTKFRASGSFDRTDPTKLSAELVVDVNSIETGIGARDNDLKSERFFNVEEFSTITYKITRAAYSEDEKQFNVTGDLTILGNTKAVTSPVSIFENADGSVTLKGSVIINRREWGMTDQISFNPVSDEVPIHITLVFQ